MDETANIGAAAILRIGSQAHCLCSVVLPPEPVIRKGGGGAIQFSWLAAMGLLWDSSNIFRDSSIEFRKYFAAIGLHRRRPTLMNSI